MLIKGNNSDWHDRNEIVGCDVTQPKNSIKF